MDPLYTAVATARGDGRNGEVTSSDGVIDERLAVPEEMGGPGGEMSNPEQLFAAGYAACFHSALQVVARKADVALGSSTVTAEVGIGRARVWRLYMAGSRLGFDRNHIELHQVLGVRLAANGTSGMPLRPDWEQPRVLTG